MGDVAGGGAKWRMHCKAVVVSLHFCVYCKKKIQLFNGFHVFTFWDMKLLILLFLYGLNLLIVFDYFLPRLQIL